jgi:hypothetical protein
VTGDAAASPSVGLLWRAEWDPPHPDGEIRESCRLHGVFAAFAALGVIAEPVIYADDRVDEVREQLRALNGVLVWVNPIEQERDRSLLDPLLREVADAGVWVSAHPDVIMKLATKSVLVDTASMSWGSDARLYRSVSELLEHLPSRLTEGARVLKQQRGMGGQGVWKVELENGSTGAASTLRVEQASRDGTPESLSLAAFARRCERYFRTGGVMVDQPFLERIGEGMIRVYLTQDRVVGFAHQYPRGLRPTDAGEPPAGKTFELPSVPAYQRLRARMEEEWVPEMQRLLDLATNELPVIWDADFLYGPKLSGADTYVLCEINASSTFAFPEHAMPTVARAALLQIAEHARQKA